MEKIRLVDGNLIPILGLGTWQLTGEACTSAVSIAIEKGYSHIDTAQVYSNEQDIGKAIRGFNREDLFIVSKVSPSNLSYDGIMESFKESVRKLNTDYLDLYLIHWPDGGAYNLKSLRAFKELHDEGKIKSFGVSNFTIEDIESIMPTLEELNLLIAVNQIEYHPFINQEELVGYCRLKKIHITSYSPLARGNIFANGILKNISDKHKRTVSQITLRWLIQKGTSVIPKASSREHIEDNFGALDFVLDEQDMKLIDGIVK